MEFWKKIGGSARLEAGLAHDSGSIGDIRVWVVYELVMYDSGSYTDWLDTALGRIRKKKVNSPGGGSGGGAWPPSLGALLAFPSRVLAALMTRAALARQPAVRADF